jgi:hypothetical protein
MDERNPVKNVPLVSLHSARAATTFEIPAFSVDPVSCLGALCDFVKRKHSVVFPMETQ